MLFEAQIKIPDEAIFSDGGDGGHIERTADGYSAAADHVLVFYISPITIRYVDVEEVDITKRR